MMNPQDVSRVYQILTQQVKYYKVPVVELIEVQTKDPFKILIATMLSARTKDETTSAVCIKLFSRVHTLHDLQRIPLQELEQLLYPVGFYKTKAKHLKKLPLVLHEQFGDTIPQTIDELLHLPGVGRKTANLVVATAFHQPAICVDTHVHRIMNRLGYLKTKTPYETEMVLRKKLPQKYWIGLNAMLVAFGQHLCRPISPHCSVCPIKKYCKRVGVSSSR